jgi:hypothetical protein
LTIIVGVKCTDGIVIGSDSIATSAAGVVPVMQIESNDKIRIFNEKVIVAATGAVGYTQRLLYHIDRAVNGGGFLTTKKSERPQNICKRFITDLQSSMAPAPPPHGIGFGAVMATEIEGEPCLIEFGPKDFQPEFKENKLFYVSMGSGQPLADPFLAFVSRVLWKNTLPDLRLGRFGAYWALSHTISLAPGTVGPPIRIATLSKVQNVWKAMHIADNEEAEQFIVSVEERIGLPFADAPAGPPAETPPVPQVG